jgi:DNA-binding FrmR family transcriptional regulator
MEVTMIDDKTEDQALKRLGKVQGQLSGIERMIRDRRYCVDVVMQIAAAEAALHNLAGVVLKNHIETCVLSAFRSRDKNDVKAKIDELMRIYGNLRPR